MFKAIVLGLALTLSSMVGAFAADGDKAADKPKADTKPVVVSEQPAPPAEVSSCDECHRGGTFTHFWTHTVGGSIGHGLKKGASKISSGF